AGPAGQGAHRKSFTRWILGRTRLLLPFAIRGRFREESPLMAWSKGFYYQRSFRREGRVVTQYLGRADRVEALVHQDAQRRARRQAQTADRRAEQAAWQQADALARFCTLVDQLVRSALAAAGYHPHDRGPLSKRRALPPPPPVPPPPNPARGLALSTKGDALLAQRSSRPSCHTTLPVPGCRGSPAASIDLSSFRS